MTFRRLLAIILLTVGLGSSAILGLFLYRFDIDLFRPEIEQELARRTALPVSLGKIYFSMKHGPAFAFDTLQIGRPGQPLQIIAKKLYLRLRFLPMLQGELAFSEMLLDEPDIRITAVAATDKMLAERPAIDLRTDDMFQSIRIKKGQLHFEDRNRAGKPFSFALEQFDLSVRDLSFNTANAIAIKGILLCNAVRSPLQATGTITPSAAASGWRNATYDMDMSVNDLATDLIADYLKRSVDEALIRGRSDLSLQLSGRPSTGVKIKALAKGRDLGLYLPGPQHTILPLKSINLSTTWRTAQARHFFDPLQLKIADLELNGELRLDLTEPTPHISASLASPAMALSTLEQMLPYTPDQDRVPAVFSGGSLTLQSLKLDGNLSQIAGPEFPAGISNLSLNIDDATLRTNSGTLKQATLALDWDGENLTLNRLQGQLNDLLIGVNGRVTPTGNAGKGFTLISEGNLYLDTTATPDPKPLLPKKLTVPYHLQTDRLSRDSHHLQLQLTLPDAPLTVDTRWQHPPGQPDTVTVSTSEIKIADVTGLSPLLQSWPLGGFITARLNLSRDASGWQPALSLTLRDASTPIPGPLARVHTINGEFSLRDNALHSAGVNAILGTSPIQVDVEIPDLHHPLTRLHVTAPEIRASDLIFSSTTAMLQDVDGIVEIGSHHVGLGPIYVSLAGGTKAVVTGNVSTTQGDVDLTIKGSYGNIDEVIALWSDDTPPETAGEAPTQPAPAHGRLTLQVTADQGIISGMPFSEATAQIERRGDTLAITPIRFRSGPGQGLGQVLLVHRDEGPPLLKISGNLSNFDAPVIHQQLLKQTSVISGELNANFYLEGVAGPTFLPTSFGGAQLQLRNGNLHKISWLSKILTVLNIYPLLTKGSSDLGLPYQKVNGNLVLRQGILSSEDIVLKSDVMNLTLIGTMNLETKEIDTTLEAMPLRSIDRILSHVPIAGWLLTGDKKALLVAHFRMTGQSDDPQIEAIPLESITAPVIGIFKRLIGLPVKLVTDPAVLLQNR